MWNRPGRGRTGRAPPRPTPRSPAGRRLKRSRERLAGATSLIALHLTRRAHSPATSAVAGDAAFRPKRNSSDTQIRQTGRVRHLAVPLIALALVGCGGNPPFSNDGAEQQRAAHATRLLLLNRGVEHVRCRRAAAGTWLCIAHGRGARYSCKVTVSKRRADPSCITGTNVRAK
jgi:hypothetical protein